MQACVRSNAPATMPPTPIAKSAFGFADRRTAECPVIDCPLLDSSVSSQTLAIQFGELEKASRVGRTVDRSRLTPASTTNGRESKSPPCRSQDRRDKDGAPAFRAANSACNLGDIVIYITIPQSRGLLASWRGKREPRVRPKS